MSPSGRAALKAAAVVMVPPSEDLAPAAWDAYFAIIGETLVGQSFALRAQIALFLAAVRWLPLLRYGAPFERLSRPQQERFLHWLEAHPVRLIRTGFWGLKTLVYMGYYGRRDVWPRLHYAPLLEGNWALHG